VTFELHADRALIRAAGGSRRFLCAEIQAPETPARPGRLPVNLVFVLDRSGSMTGAKIASAREAVLHGLRSLRPEDRFAVVAYDEHVDVVVPTTPATPQAREAAATRVSTIEARGTTDLHGGWQAGCEQVAEQLSSEAVGRCVLLTDGLANSGITDHDEIVRRCAAFRERRVVTTAFGVGADFDETLLRRIADAACGPSARAGPRSAGCTRRRAAASSTSAGTGATWRSSSRPPTCAPPAAPRWSAAACPWTASGASSR
jgi:secreted protein with Ig-like and vWFA domain